MQENAVIENTTVEVVPKIIPVRKSTRERKSAISDDYYLFSTKVEFDLGEDNDPKSYKEAMQSINNEKWRLVMEDELLSMSKNCVWKLVERTKEMKPIGCKWVFKTKRNANGKIERYKALLVAKGYNQKE